MADYSVQPNKSQDEFHITHTPSKSFVSVIRKTFGPRAAKPGKTGLEVFHIHNQKGAPTKGFFSLDAAVRHSIHLHKQIAPVVQHAVEHPMKAVGKLINDLGKAIWSGSSHPQISEIDHKKIHEISKAHAELVKTYNDHYG